MSLSFDLAYFLLSLILAVYAAFRYFRQRSKDLLLFTLSFAFLTASTTPQLIQEIANTYGVYFTITTQRILELTALALFVCFAATAVFAIKERTKRTVEDQKAEEKKP